METAEGSNKEQINTIQKLQKMFCDVCLFFGDVVCSVAQSFAQSLLLLAKCSKQILHTQFIDTSRCIALRYAACPFLMQRIELNGCQ